MPKDKYPMPKKGYITSRKAITLCRERLENEPITEHNAELIRELTNIIATVVP